MHCVSGQHCVWTAIIPPLKWPCIVVAALTAAEIFESGLVVLCHRDKVDYTLCSAMYTVTLVCKNRVLRVTEMRQTSSRTTNSLHIPHTLNTLQVLHEIDSRVQQSLM